MKMEKNLNIKIIGVAGVARAGKDTFGNAAGKKIKSLNYDYQILSFADEVKRDLDPLIKKTFGFSAFTEVTEEKEIIRPVLIAWGTHVMRKHNGNHWIDKIQKNIKNDANVVYVVTDVRYVNECEWIQSFNQGCVVHVSRDNVKPNNTEEIKNDPILQKKCDVKLILPDLSENNKEHQKKYDHFLNDFIKNYLNNEY